MPGILASKVKKNETHHTSIYTTTAAFFLIAQQCGLRCLTFAANQILLRHLPPEVLGISAQLELYLVTVLFFSRDSLRVTLQRQHEPPQLSGSYCGEVQLRGDTRNQHKIQIIVNLAYISLCMGTVAAFVFAWIYLRSLSTAETFAFQMPYLKLSLLLFGIASILELIAEPCYVVMQYRSLHHIRAASESIATLMRCFTVCISAVVAVKIGIQIGVLPFALGQLVYSSSLITVYYWNVIQISSTEGFSLLPRLIYFPKTESKNYIFGFFSRPLLSLARSFFIQSLFKHFLTQGDTFIISILASPYEQGIFSLANHYGGLIARLLLQPIEEISRNYFGQLLSNTDGNSMHKIQSAQKSLLQLLRSYLIFTIIILSIGPKAVPVLLKIVAGSRWSESSASEALANYCYYIPLLAINGITEAFVSSVATESELHIQTIWMVLFSVVLSGSAFVIVKLWDYGAQGLIMINALNMVFRITWATIFIQTYLKRYDVKLNLDHLLPHPMTIAAGIAVSATIAKFDTILDGSFLDIFKLGVLAGGLLVYISITEQNHFLDCYYKLQSHK